MQSSIKSILNGVVVIVVVLWLLNIVGIFHSLSNTSALAKADLVKSEFEPALWQALCHKEKL
jgi:hypothetical protein